MAAYESFDPGAEVKGVEVNSIVQAADHLSTVFGERMETVLATNGLGSVRSDGWYSLQSYLDVIQTIERQVGEKAVFYIGKKLPELTEWPGGVETVVEGMESISEAYETVHRGGDVGYYRVESVSDTELRLRCRNPYPCALDRGVVRGTGERFSPPTAYVDLEERGTRCRDDGADECVYEVTW
jgi:hypothetical protein